MERIVDLSGPIENGMWGYGVLPGMGGLVPSVEIDTFATIEAHGFFSSRISMSTVSGTYLEAGSHILPDGKNINEYPPERFIRPAKVIRLPEQEPEALVDAGLLNEHAPVIEPGDAIVVDTGWHRRWNRPGYVLECPHYRQDALEWVLAKKPSIFGVDVPCIEAAWSEDDGEEKGSLLAELFGTDALLLAPLVNLDLVRKLSGTLYCFPLPLVGTSGAPARVLFAEG
ncbi:MAG: cyclase family protein [Spirochaetes bacterium]|nr:cyclase family protein [Spirochaetota bacterium]